MKESEIDRITRDRESDPILKKVRLFRHSGSESQRLLDKIRFLEDLKADGFSGGALKQPEPAAPLSVAPHAESLFQKKLREVLRENPELSVARTSADGTTTDLETQTDASLAKLKAQRAARELPFGSLGSLKKRAMRPDVKESLFSPERLFYLIDRIQTLPDGSRENLLRRFGANPDVEDDDELCWLLLWAAARDMDIDSEYFWEAIPREIDTVLNYSVHSEEERKKLEAEKRKLDDELWDARRQIRRLSFSARLHQAVHHSTSTSTVPAMPDDSDRSPEPMRQAESPGAKPDVLEFWPGSGISGAVQAHLDRIRHKTTSDGRPTKQPTATGGETEIKEKCAARRAWMDDRHPGWSLVDWSKHTGVDYKTLRKYWNGITTTRTRSIRADIGRAEKVAFSEVPE